MKSCLDSVRINFNKTSQSQTGRSVQATGKPGFLEAGARAIVAGDSCTRGRGIALSMFFFLALAGTGGCRYAGSSHANADSPAQGAITDETALWILKQARQVLVGKSAGVIKPAPYEATRKSACQVILNVFTEPAGPKTAAETVFSGWGDGDSLVAGVAAAVSSLKKRSRTTQCPESSRIQIDFISGSCETIEKPTSENTESAAELVNPGADGLKIEDSGAVYYLAPSALIYRRVFDPDPEAQPASEFLNNACLLCGLPAQRWTAPGLRLWSFHTVSFVEDSSRSRALRVVRGTVAGMPVDGEHLAAAARLAGDYLIRAQQQDGSFHYYYHPMLERADSKRYNIIRHEGAASSLFELYHVTGDRRYLLTAVRAVDFLKNRIKSFSKHAAGEANKSSSTQGESASPGVADTVYVAADGEDDRTQLGANGLGLLVLINEIKYQKKSGDEELARKLARMILIMQKKDGSFSNAYYTSGEGAEDLPSLYYPGEAMLALMNLYEMTKDKKLLDSVRRGADILMRAEKQLGDLPPDAWFAQALEKLFAVTGERSYADYAIDLAVSMVDSQYADNAPEGYAGGIAPGIPRAVQSASRAEGVLAGYRLARQITDWRSAKLLSGLKSSAAFDMSQQFTADNSFFLPDPSRAMGGIRESITSMRIRIDYVQHTISSLLGLYSLAN